MGQRCSDREPESTDDHARMVALAAAGVRAGALSFGIAHHHHTILAGRHLPTLKADQAELAIAQALAKVGSGWPLIGLGDGGAHVDILSDASASTYMLTRTHDRTLRILACHERKTPRILNPSAQERLVPSHHATCSPFHPDDGRRATSH
jgi:hypothetical protein